MKRRLSMMSFYSDLSTQLLKYRLAELNKSAILTLQEGQMKDTIEKVLLKRGEFNVLNESK